MAARRFRIRRASLAVGAAASLAAVVGVAAPVSATTPSVGLAGSVPSWVAHARDLGAVSGSAPVDFAVVLRLPDPAAAEAEATAISTPGSADFHHFITTNDFAGSVGPSAAAVGAVTSWLQGAGLHIASIAPSHLYVEATGTMAQAEQLVGTALHTFQYDGKQLAAPVSSYRVPSGLGADIDGIIGLDGTALLQRPADTLPGPPPGARYGVQPCSAYYGQKIATNKPEAYGQHWPYTVCGYNADQMEQAFGLYQGIQDKTADGTGATVAITDAYAAPTILSDANAWSGQNDLPTFSSGQFTQVTPGSDGYNQESACDPQGWYGEETLDVEAVHAMAPGARVVYVGGANCGAGLDLAWAHTIDEHLADVVTDSWSDLGENLPPAMIDFFTYYLVLAADTGVTVQFSSGDDGDNVAATGTKSVNFPASDPFATGVGGTSTEIGKSGSIVFQHGWSTAYSQLVDGAWSPTPPGTYSSGAGGGTSQVFSQPRYQRGVVPASISEYYGSTPMRAVPDIAMPADPNTGLTVGETQKFADGTYYSTYRIGGTSLASPLLAGVVADAVGANKAPAGFLNPVIYADSDTAAITDVLPPSSPTATVRTNFTNNVNPLQGKSWELQTIDYQGTTLHTLPGYDDETGVGTPDGAAFLKALAG